MADAAAWARLAVAVAVVAGTVYLMVRRVDVRLVLLGAGLVMATAAGKPLAVPDTFTRAMVAVMVGPICAALGFAAVLRATGCDAHLVRLLLLPVRRAGRAVVPAGVLTACLVNLAVPSQTSAAASVGPILVPLLAAAGIGPRWAGAVLLVGASCGGDLLNPGAQDVQAIAGVTGLPARAIHSALAPAVLAGVAVAALTLTLLARPAAGLPVPPPPAGTGEPLSLIKALIPLFPTALLLAANAGTPGLGWLLAVPEGEGWAEFAGALPVVRAMLLGTALAAAVGWRDVQALTQRFFSETGVAYGTIIALTITAQCFGAGLAALGVSQGLLGLVAGSRWALGLLALAFTGSLAVLSGSGSGPVLTFAETVLKGVPAGDDPVTVAALACLGGAYGRTASPVAAVVLYTSGLVGVSPLALVRQALPALLAGAAVAVAVVAAGVRLP